MSTDLQGSVVAPFNALRKRLSEWLNAQTDKNAFLHTLSALVPHGAGVGVVAAVLSSDVLRVLCDCGYGLKDSSFKPEVASLFAPLVNALLKQLPGSKADYPIALFRIDAEPFGYECSRTKWMGARLVAKASESTGDNSLKTDYLNIINTVLQFFPEQHFEVCLADLVEMLSKPEEERPFDSTDGLSATIVNSIGMRLLLIQPGQFVMGASRGDAAADPVEEMPHDVRITKAFYLGECQVTQHQYKQIIGENPSMFRGRFRPVEHLSWEDAWEFCRRLSDLPAEREAGRIYRLPTEAEWEYACRAGTATQFWTGDDLVSSQACVSSEGLLDGTSRPTRSVGSFPANPWGLFDMHGNVWEWCSDWFGREYYRSSPTDDPQGPASGSHHVLRGGGASSLTHLCRSSSRGEAMRDGPSYDLKNAIAWFGDLGMRVACVLPPQSPDNRSQSRKA